MTMMVNSGHDKGHSTPVSNYLVGATQVQCKVHSDEEDEMAPQHLPPTMASPCLQGGTGANSHITTSTMTGVE